MAHRFVLIGPGAVSANYRAAADKLGTVSFTGVVGRTREKARAFAQREHIEHWGSDIGVVARASGAECALICTPNATHYQGVVESAAAGLHVLCEKPLHIDPARQRDMIAACEKAGVKLGVCYGRRLGPHIQCVRNMVQEGVLGRIFAIDTTIRLFRPESYYAGSWHGTNAIDGGGPFIQQGSHFIDLAVWIGGGWSEVLCARRFTLAHDIETEDHGYAVVRYGCGAVGMIEASTAFPGNGEETITVSGERGTVSFGAGGFVDWKIEGCAPPARLDPVDRFEGILQDFVNAVETGADPIAPGDDGGRATDLIAEMYHKSGDPVRL